MSETTAPDTSTPRNVIIIGSGPTGYTAAVYAARAALEPLVFEGSVTAGGALMNTTEVENFPGFRDGIMGPALMDEMRAQAERFGAELVSDDIVEVDLTGDIKVVKTATDTYTARSVVLATGSGYRKLGLPREEELSGRGVSWCATCDGFFFREQAIAVIGGGDSAVEEATFLTRFGSKVYLIHRRDELRASKIMQERAFADPKLEMVWNSEITAINGEERLESLTLRDTVTGEERQLDVTGLFIAIGHDPRSELLTGQVDLDDDGYVLVDHPSTATNLPGVFAAGDLVDHHYRQAITAAGTGCAAALDAERFIAALDHEASTAGAAAAVVEAIAEEVSPRPRCGVPGYPGLSWSAPMHQPRTRSLRPRFRHHSAAGNICQWGGVHLTTDVIRQPKGHHRGQHRRRDRRRVRGAGPQVRQARPRGLLGRVVRPVPPGRPDPRRAQHRAR